MKIRELIEVSPNCDVIEVVVRENGHGKWIQGYMIGKNIDFYPAFQRKDVIEDRQNNRKRHLKDGQEVDGEHGMRLPMKLIKKNVTSAPDYIMNLEISHIQPRHIPCYHKDQLTHNDFQYDVSAYPDGWNPNIKENDDNIKRNNDDVKQKIDVQLDGQMDITDFLGE